VGLTGTEADVINSVASLKLATKDQVRRKIGFSLEYTGFLCRDLIRRGYLNFAQGRYCLAGKGIKSLLREETPKIDRELLKEIAGEVAREIGGELKKTVKGIKLPVAVGAPGKAAGAGAEERPKIKMDFDFPVEDESLTLESNIGKIGAKLEKEKADIDQAVRLFKKFTGKPDFGKEKIK
jgi:hypothetical protein